MRNLAFFLSSFLLSALLVIALDSYSYAGYEYKVDTHVNDKEFTYDDCLVRCATRGGVWYFLKYGEKISIVRPDLYHSCRCLDEI